MSAAATGPGSRLRRAREATLQLRLLSEIAAAESFDAVVNPLCASLALLDVPGGRLALLEASSDAFHVRRRITCGVDGNSAGGGRPSRFDRSDPIVETVFDRGECTLWRPFAKGRRTLSMAADGRNGADHGASLSLAARPTGGWRVSLCVSPAGDEPLEAFDARSASLEAPLRLIVDAALQPASRMIATLPAPKLSPVETAVLELLAQGKRPAGIAAARGVVEPTVRNQVIAIRRKLGARSNAHAVAIAMRRGLIHNL